MRRKPRIIQIGWTRGKPSRKGDRPIEFLMDRVVIYFVFIFLLRIGLLNCIKCNPVPRGTRNHPHEALWNSDLTSADSGLQLDLEIALSGVPAKVQPHGFFQPCRRCVETSDDVTEKIST